MRSVFSRFKFWESRGGATSPWGKLDGWMDGFRVEKSVKEAFARKAAAMTPPRGSAELLRDCMRVVAFGAEEVKRLRAQDVEQVDGMLAGMLGRDSGPGRINDS